MAAGAPFQSLNAASTVFNGTSQDMSGTAALAAAMHSAVVTVSGYAASSQIPDVVPTNPYAQVQLQVSLDGTNFVTLAQVNVNNNGNYAIGPASYPARYARAVVVRIDPRITGISISCYVASST